MDGAAKGNSNTHNNVGDSLWAVKVNKLIVGETDVPITPTTDSQDVFVFDSGLPFIWLNNLFYSEFQAMV